MNIAVVDPPGNLLGLGGFRNYESLPESVSSTFGLPKNHKGPTRIYISYNKSMFSVSFQFFRVFPVFFGEVTGHFSSSSSGTPLHGLSPFVLVPFLRKELLEVECWGWKNGRSKGVVDGFGMVGRMGWMGFGMG